MLSKETSTRIKEFEIERVDFCRDTGDMFIEEDGTFVYHFDALQKVNELVAYIEFLEGRLAKYEAKISTNLYAR